MEQFLTLLLGIVAGALLVGGRAYFTEKGKNLATKEDIAGITAEVERIRSEQLAQLERVKSELGHTQLVNRTQFELELAAYREVWQAIIPVHRAAAELRPMFDSGLGAGETEQSRKQDRLARFAHAFNPLSETVWKHRPFYPADVFQELTELLRLLRSEAIDYQVRDPNRQEDYWDKADASAKAIGAQVEKVCETIRARIAVTRIA